jgi:hypothetical protein
VPISWLSVPALPAMSVLYTRGLPAMPSAKPPKKRRARTAARSKSKRSKPKPKAVKKRSKPKAVNKRSPKPKLRKRKLIAPRKGPPPKPAKSADEIRAIKHKLDDLESRGRAQERQLTDLEDRWKMIDPYEDFEREASRGGVLDEDEDRADIDPDGDPDAPGFDRWLDLAPSMDVHDYIAWIAEEFDLDYGELYELYFGYEDD